MNLPRLDLLIYAHDGRGLGHASRSIAIGMAFRRLFPEKRVLFLSGTRACDSLIGGAPLDWIKLPAYETRVTGGKSSGARGKSNFTDKELGEYRKETIRHVVERFRPRCVLADHSPQGKHKELLPALNLKKHWKSRWVLGVRGVVGEVSQVKSRLAQETFNSFFHALLWYGSSKVLGPDAKMRMGAFYATTPVETGYVSRLSESVHWRSRETLSPHLAGTISIPWMGEKTGPMLTQLAKALESIGDRFGQWRIFLGFNDNGEAISQAFTLFDRLPFCQAAPAGSTYADALMQSRIALIFGGYNSLMDVLWTRKPSVVVVRGMADQEQELHLQRLCQTNPSFFHVVDEASATPEALAQALTAQLLSTAEPNPAVSLDGAEVAAGYLGEVVDEVCD